MKFHSLSITGRMHFIELAIFSLMDSFSDKIKFPQLHTVGISGGVMVSKLE